MKLMESLVICVRTGYLDPVSKFITRFQIRVIYTRFLHSLLTKNAILAWLFLCISLWEDFDFPLLATIGTIFVDVGIYIVLQLQTFSIKTSL